MNLELWAGGGDNEAWKTTSCSDIHKDLVALPDQRKSSQRLSIMTRNTIFGTAGTHQGETGIPTAKLLVVLMKSFEDGAVQRLGKTKVHELLLEFCRRQRR